MEMEEFVDKLKELADEWEAFECGELTAETEDWNAATEATMWSCAAKLQDLILELEED